MELSIHMQRTHGTKLASKPFVDAGCSSLQRSNYSKGMETAMDKTKKCKHAGCGCAAPEGKDYCSEVCKDAKSVIEITCQCRHPQCGGEQLKP